MSTKKVNKYNVKAIRKDLDSCLRSHAWKRFRTVLRGCCPPSCFDGEVCDSNREDADATANSGEQHGTSSKDVDKADTSLLEAIVMDRPRSTRGTPSSHPTLLHALIDKINSGSCTSKSGYGRRSANQLPPPYDIIDVIAHNVPQALLVQDGRNGRTPLHLAISRNACPSIIESLIQNDHSRNSLQMVDRRNDTPIICYIKTSDSLDFDEGEIGHLLLKGEQGDEMLMKYGGKKNKVPLFYAVAKELREIGLLHVEEGMFQDDVRLPDSLRYLLVKTYNVWLAQEKIKNDITAQIQNLDTFDIENAADVPLLSVFASATSCPHLFEEFEKQMFTILLREIEQELDILQGEAETNLVDEKGNAPLHLFMLHYRIGFEDSGYYHLAKGDLHKCLIECFPESLRLQNEQGNIPLHMACLGAPSAICFRDICNAFAEGVQYRNKRGELPLHLFLKRVGSPGRNIRPRYVLELLSGAGPETVAIQDGPTGLYPFQLAVESTVFDSPSPRKRGTTEDQIELCYYLLKKCPQLCATALEGTA